MIRPNSMAADGRAEEAANSENCSEWAGVGTRRSGRVALDGLCGLIQASATPAAGILQVSVRSL